MKPKELFLNPGLTNYSTIFSSMFLHGGFMHLIGNMLFYGFMEIILKMLWGTLNFYYFILCGLAAALSQALVTPNSDIPMIGASGAVSEF